MNPPRDSFLRAIWRANQHKELTSTERFAIFATIVYGNSGEEFGAAEIANMMNLSHRKTNGIIRRLETKGYLRRLEDQA